MSTDPRFATFVLRLLLGNALEHGKANGANEINVNADGTCCMVCDNGRLIPEQLAVEFFDYGNTRRSSGGGYGLYIAREFSKDLGATLKFERRQNRNCFVFELGDQRNGNN